MTVERTRDHAPSERPVNHNPGGRGPKAPEPVRREAGSWTRPDVVLRNPPLGRSLEGLEATKGIGIGRRWPSVALIGGAEPHDHLSLCSSRLLRSLPG